jgi:hypothetical protein
VRVRRLSGATGSRTNTSEVVASFETQRHWQALVDLVACLIVFGAHAWPGTWVLVGMRLLDDCSRRH